MKKNVKIFVSNRIDLDSVTINDDPYVNIRCGAVFDHREGITMLGDNTGDNISNKRMSYCELTVQYWAWKNIDADYYGLCHYRRYLSFDSKEHKVSKSEHDNGCISIDYLTDAVRKKFKLDDQSIQEITDNFDVIACAPTDSPKSNLQAMKDSPDYHNIEDMYEAIKIIHEKYPDMDSIVHEYMNSKKVRLYNCWIMSKKIFKEYSQWLFSILFELEKRIDMSTYGLQKYRTPGTIGERLFGIYCLYLTKRKDVRFKNQQLLFIEHPEKNTPLKPFWGKDQVTIASNFNNNYVHTFSVSLISFLKSINPYIKYEFIVLSEDISENNKKIINSIVKEYNNVHLSFYNPFFLLSGAKLFVNNSAYSKDLYVRVIIPYILSKYDKVLMVDADTIIEKDLALLYDTDVDKYMMAAVRDVVYGGYINGVVPGTLEYTKNVLHLDNPYNYCNTGVILLNLARIRSKYSCEEILHEIDIQRYRVYEQDMLNSLFRNQVLFLDPRWNLFTYTSEIIKKCVEMAPLDDYLEYQKAREEPFIIHYAAHPKPWWTNNADFGVVFWRFAKLSPFYEELVAQLSWNVANGLYEFKRHGGFRESLPRRIADVFLPKGTARREFVKKIIPKDSLPWRISKKIYYLFANH